MSRLKNFVHSLTSGYALLAFNTVYALVSARLGLQYLSNRGPGLWMLVLNAAGFLQLVDLGMSGSIFRTLVDHKDQPAGGAYGSFIKTSVLVLLVQGLIIAVLGLALAAVLPSWVLAKEDYPAYHKIFTVLFGAQCLVMGVFFPARIASYILQAHSRFDIFNYAGMGNQAAGLAALWIGFRLGWGFNSLIAGVIASNVTGYGLSLVMVARLRLWPPAGAWGRAQWKVFKELFAFGSDLFLLGVGYQLLNATQAAIASRTCGLVGATVWGFSTKAFLLAQQIVNQLLTFSSSALSEMIVRGEPQRLRARFRDLLVLTVSASVFIGAGLGVCNSSFVEIWSKGKVSWNPLNNWLMALLLVVTCLTRCHTGLPGLLKRIGNLRYLYFLEGMSFLALSLLLAPRYGLSAILVTAIAMDVLWSGIYGVWRSARYFNETMFNVAFGWTKVSWNYLAAMAVPSVGWWWLTSLWFSGIRQFLLGGTGVAVLGLLLLWWIGLTPDLKSQLSSMLSKFKLKLGLS
jgi:O-antigen/teichoic acid export membrane protein